jgi:hypothetical protein
VAASESVRLQRINYTDGAAGLLNLLDAERQYQQAARDYARAAAQRYQDTVELWVAVGGARILPWLMIARLRTIASPVQFNELLRMTCGDPLWQCVTSTT